MTLFSVIIPLYNKAEHISDTLKSVVAQEFQDFEVIVVNDGSTDNSLEIVAKIEDARLSLHTLENKGVSAARNYGVKKALGKYLIFLDADDLWEVNHLKVLANLINKYPNATLFCSGYKRQAGENNFQRAHFGKIPDNFIGFVDDYFKQSLPFSIAGMGTACVSKENFLAIGGFTENVSHGEDIELWTSLALRGSVALQNTPTVIHKLDAENRVSNLKAKDKTFPDFSQFLMLETQKPTLKHYLDNNRYGIALDYKLAGDRENFQLWKSRIAVSNLNWKQRLLLFLPTRLALSLKKVHYVLLKHGFYISTFR